MPLKQNLKKKEKKNKMSKIGVVYNVFDGEELLEDSILSIKANVDYICVVYQTVSNFGDFNDNCEDVVLRLLGKGLIDYAYKYYPKIMYKNQTDISWESGYTNEIVKRNIGLNLCRDYACTHLLMMDCDEFYQAEQFDFALKEIIDGNYDTSFCQMVTYYKEPTYRLEPKEKYYVPFIIKIKPDTVYELINDYPVLVDQTRKVKAGNCIVFSRNEIEMHHYSFVRKDISKKFKNSSSQYSDIELNSVIDCFSNFVVGKKAKLLGLREFDVVLTDNIFNLGL